MNSIWMRKRRTLIATIILVMIVIMAVTFVNQYKWVIDDLTDSDDESQEHYTNMYNASRYFFRVNYPDDWGVTSQNHGFYLDNESFLVLELYYQIYTGPESVPPTPSATGAPIPDMQRVEDMTASFYYVPFGSDISEVDRSLTSVALSVLDEFSGKMQAFDSLTLNPLEEYATEDITFMTFSYTYNGAGGLPYAGDIYVAVRSFGYYVIRYEGGVGAETSTFYTQRDKFAYVIDDFRFSVFED